MSNMILRKTASICPVCKKRIRAFYEEENGEVLFSGFCPEHGDFRTAIWRGEPSLLDWAGCCGVDPDEQNPNCPDECGLCDGHANETCCTVLDITDRCNLGCHFCFANGGNGKDIPLEEVTAALDDIYSKGRRFIHISGGEPTIHPDLCSIVEHAKSTGFEYIQINTNGIALAEDDLLAEKLGNAGASCIFLQFDGITDSVHEQIRGVPLKELKLKAIANCENAGLGVVLVPTLIPGINTSQIGDIISFGINHMPTVRGVHFQPVTYTGRFSKGEHMTMPELIRAIDMQTGGMIPASSLSPSVCDSPLCGFHCEMRKEDNTLKIIPASGKCCCGSPDVSKNQNHVKYRWTRIKSSEFEEGSIDSLINEINESTFCISGMMFMDLSNLDLGRVMQCSVHVYKSGSFIPFCVYNNVYGRQFERE